MLIAYFCARDQILSKKHGFTLLEVLAVLVIAGILAAVGVPSGFNFWARIQQEEAQNTVNRALRTTRSNAKASLSGQIWTMSIVEEGDVPVIVIEDIGNDGAPLCRELIACQRIPLNNSVTVDPSFNGTNRAAFNSRGEAINVDGGGLPNGSFIIESRFLPSLPRRCVVVSTALGAIRTGAGSACPDMGPDQVEGLDDNDG